MGGWNHDLLPALLVSLLLIVLITGGAFVFLIAHWRRRQTLDSFAVAGTTTKRSPRDFSAAFRHAALKRPACWLAIKNRNLLAVQSALALHNSKPCSWEEGLSANGDQKVFVSPPVSGWILVIGPALPEPSDDVDACFRFLMDLSRKLGHVQFFSANSVLNHHAWAQVECGRVLRAYAWADKTLWNQGKTTPAETELSLQCHDYADAVEASLFNPAESGPTNSDKVHLLAARWSIDPEEIDERFTEREWGIVGEPAKYF